MSKLLSSPDLKSTKPPELIKTKIKTKHTFQPNPNKVNQSFELQRTKIKKTQKSDVHRSKSRASTAMCVACNLDRPLLATAYACVCVCWTFVSNWTGSVDMISLVRILFVSLSPFLTKVCVQGRRISFTGDISCE